MQPSAGLKFAQYELLSQLGVGGMGEVWRARDHSLGRDVAIKFIVQAAIAHPNRLARLEREARAASALNHPNIVTIHAFGREQDRAYIVLEVVEGQSLRDLLNGHAIPLPQALDIAGQMADGLARAHAAGIVHRDLKPDNVMVTPDGLVKLLDFGLAKLVTPAQGPEADTQSGEKDSADATREGVVLGTVGYMSPEQARGKEIDHRSDQFSLGSILYEMLCGRRAFHKGSSVETLIAIVSEEPEPLSADVPAPLRWTLERLLAKDADGRYHSTLDLARELRGIREHLDEVRRTKSSPRAPAPRGSWPRVGPAGTAAVALLVLAGVPFRDTLLPGVFESAPSGGHVAVLPFKYVGENPKGPVVCEGLVDILSSKLTQLEQFQGAFTVVPSAEVVSAGIDTPSAARRRFGATLVVTGSVHERGGRIRAQASLVDAETLHQVRSVEVDDASGELFRLEERLLQQMLDMLRVRVGAGRQQVLAAGHTSVNDAYAAYVQARGLLQRHDRAGNLEAAVVLLEDAVARDPRYALAHATLAQAYWQQYEERRDADLIRRARDSAARALALEGRLAPAWVTLAMIERGTGQPKQAVQHADKALALEPISADAHRERARALEDLGEVRKAEEAYGQAVELRPNDWNAYNQLGGFLLAQRRHGEARQQFARVTEIAPDNVRGWNNLGSVEYARERFDEARRAWETSARIAPGGTASSNLGTLAFFQGRYADAARAFEDAVKFRATDHRLWTNLGGALYWAGEKDKARAAYERALSLGENERRVTPGDARLLARLADCYAMLGRSAEARAVLGDALAGRPQDPRVMFTAGEVYEHLGQREDALRWIAAAREAGYPAREIERSPGLDALRKDPRFRKAATAD